MLTGEGSRATLAIWAIAALLGGLVLVRTGGCGEDAGVRVARAPSARDPAASTASAGVAVYVHVAGEVRQPGLLKLAQGTRVAEAIERAGGPSHRADLAAVNLAAKLEDGQQVIVPRRGATPAGAAGAGVGVGAAGAAPPSPALPGSPPGSAGVPKLSLAAVTIEQLDQLDGIGPTLAQRIVQYRTEHGGFRSLGELREVEGIGEKRFESLSQALQP